MRLLALLVCACAVGCGKKDASPVSPAQDYTFSVKRKLEKHEIRQLEERCMPCLVALSGRYAPQIDISEGFPKKPVYPDLLRGKWMLDESSDRPDHRDVVDGLGFAFGRILEAKLGMQWCRIQDPFGECISLVAFPPSPDAEYEKVSFPTFSYVEKREKVQNVEVFVDAFKLLQEMTGQGEASNPRVQSDAAGQGNGHDN